MRCHMPTAPRVAFFATCLADFVFPDIAGNAVLLLEQAGCQVIFNPRQTCCGQPLINAGFHAEAFRNVALQIDVLLEDEADFVVCPSGSCALQIRKYADLFSDKPALAAKARHLAAKTFELTDFLVNVMGLTDFGARLAGKAVYHPSCHMTRMLGVKDPPLALLDKVEGLQLVRCKGQERCCGFGGLFAVKLGALSGAMAREKVENILETGARFLIGADAGCLMHLEGVIRREKYPLTVYHITQVLMQGR